VVPSIAGKFNSYNPAVEISIAHIAHIAHIARISRIAL